MDFKSEKNISNSSSSNSDERADPDYNESPQTRSVNKTKNVPIQIVVEEVGTSSGTSRRRRRVRPPNKRSRDEGIISLSLRRPTRSRGCTNNNQDHGKRTILSWLIDTNAIQQHQKVCYMGKTREIVWLEGIITRDGILCNCCDKILNAFDFEMHAGGYLKRPYENIFVQDLRISLLSCMREAWERVGKIGGPKLKNVESTSSSSDKHDDACIICADGGNLLCCETCPSTYHQDCMAMEGVPEGAWLCPYCVCKFCGNTCGENDFLITCFQCEKKYHWECYQERRNSEFIDANSPGTPLCDQSCIEVFEKLEKMVGVRKELDEGFTWTLLRRMDQEFGVRVNDLYQMIECHSKLAIARIVIEECFETITDRYTRINVLQNVVYNCESHYIRTNFRGFYTAILEKDEEIISVASLRIHGTKLAEMPFIATLENYRRQGMCRRLMVAIESALCYLKVESLVIPSVHETIGSWIDRFGFKHIDPSMINELRLWNTLTFHDAYRLQKVLTFTAGAREVHESENSDNKNQSSSSNNSRVQALFNLNFEPPQEVQEISDDGEVTSNNTE